MCRIVLSYLICHDTLLRARKGVIGTLIFEKLDMNMIFDRQRGCVAKQLATLRGIT